MVQHENYKKAKNPYLRLIPNEWEEIPVRAVCSIKSLQNNSAEELLSVFLNLGVIPYSTTSKKQVHKPSEDMSKYQLVEPGDLVLNNQQAWRGSLGVSKYRGIVSPAYIVMSVNNCLNSAFVNYMVRERTFVSQLVVASKGVGSIQRILQPGKLKNSYFIIPSREEQDQIVRYLDWQTSKINQLIDAKKKQIQVLREHALSVCNELLTRGINPNVTFKPTGSNWMGEIPAHWKISKIAKHFTIKKRIAGKEGYDVLSITQQGLKVKDISTNEGQMAANYSGYQFVYPGDFAMNHMDLLTGYIDISKHFGVTSPDYRVFVLDDTKNCYPEYYLQLFQLCYKRKIFYGYGRGAANQGRWRMPAVNFRNFEIPLPPYEEQKIISAKIQEINARIESACSKLESESSTLSEMKTRLVSDVVTGQIDVRNIDVPAFESVEEMVDDADIAEDVNVEEEE